MTAQITELVTRNKLTIEQVRKILMRLSYHYLEANHTPETIKLIADDYFEEFKALSIEQFQEAIKIARSESKFFPKISEIKEIVDSYSIINSPRKKKRTCAECYFLHRQCEGKTTPNNPECPLFSDDD